MSTATKSAPTMTTKKSILVAGSVLSETSFYVVKSLTPNGIIATDDLGNEITLSNNYVEKILASADYFLSEEKKNMTELAELFISSPRIAMTVAFTTKSGEKTKKEYEHEKSAKIDEILNANLLTTQKLLEDLIENPITRVIPGSLRVMKGRHYGTPDELGRLSFIDMGETRDVTKDYDTRTRKVDPRTISWIIVGGVKYSLK